MAHDTVKQQQAGSGVNRVKAALVIFVLTITIFPAGSALRQISPSEQ